MTITTALSGALNDAISSGKFIDTKVILFSRRDGSGRVCEPKALYANSHVLKTVPYFNDLLSSAFSESELKDFSEPVDNGDLAEDYSYLLDSDLEEDWDFESLDPEENRPQNHQKGAAYGRYKEHIRKGKVIKIQDVAFITFQAFLLYLYTNSINFAPFGTGVNRRSRSSEIAWTREGGIPRPSPKSIYRLADKYDVPELKRRAFQSIKNGLKNCDIVQEAFSEYTSKYSEIRTAQVNHLLCVLSSGSEEELKLIREKLDRKIDGYSAGELDHAVDVISLVWEASNKEGSTTGGTEQTPIPFDSSRFPSLIDSLHTDFKGCDMRLQLVKSIKEGCLFDRRYWARSRAGAVEPIYSSEDVIRAELTCLDTLLERHLGHGGQLDKDEEEGYTEDSDYENAHEIPCEQGSENFSSDQKQKRRLYPVLKIGSSTAWKSLFFYLLTGEIRFAPLKSQGLEHRSRWILSNTMPGSPTPCSPKTIYLLTERLSRGPSMSGLAHLNKRAITDIEAKLTEANVLAETFSTFAAQHTEIMKVVWKYLSTKLEVEKTKSSVLEFIKDMEGGNAPHRANALKFGLDKALRQKYEGRRAEGETPSTPPARGYPSISVQSTGRGGSLRGRGRGLRGLRLTVTEDD